MFHIRKATTADIPLINQLARQVFPQTYQSIITPEQIDFMMDWMYSPESLRKQMEEEGHIYYIAFEECEGAGYVSIQPLGPDLYELQKIYVLPYFQKYHLGRQLFEHAVRSIHELHPEPCMMELRVNRQNPALGFYEHMGMTKLREDDAHIGNGFYMNDYIMGLEVK